MCNVSPRYLETLTERLSKANSCNFTRQSHNGPADRYPRCKLEAGQQPVICRCVCWRHIWHRRVHITCIHQHSFGQRHGLCIYIVGRNAQSAKKIISDCIAKCPDGQYHFIQAKDLSLLQNVDKAAAEIIQHQQQNTSESYVPRVDMLFMTQGGLYPTPRQGTLILLDFSSLLLPIADSSTTQTHKKASTSPCQCTTTPPRASSSSCFPCCNHLPSHRTWYRYLKPARKQSYSPTTCLCANPATTTLETPDLTAPL